MHLESWIWRTIDLQPECCPLNAIYSWFRLLLWIGVCVSRKQPSMKKAHKNTLNTVDSVRFEVCWLLLFCLSKQPTTSAATEHVLIRVFPHTTKPNTIANIFRPLWWARITYRHSSFRIWHAAEPARTICWDMTEILCTFNTHALVSMYKLACMCHYPERV